MMAGGHVLLLRKALQVTRYHGLMPACQNLTVLACGLGCEEMGCIEPGFAIVRLQMKRQKGKMP